MYTGHYSCVLLLRAWTKEMFSLIITFAEDENQTSRGVSRRVSDLLKRTGFPFLLGLCARAWKQTWVFLMML